MMLKVEDRINLQSKTLNAVKMLMILFVIFIHMNPTTDRCGEVAMWWHSIVVVAVPVFFIRYITLLYWQTYLRFYCGLLMKKFVIGYHI